MKALLMRLAFQSVYCTEAGVPHLIHRVRAEFTRLAVLEPGLWTWTRTYAAFFPASQAFTLELELT